MEKENDNFWLYIGGVIVLVIGLVVVFKGIERAPDKAFAETKAEIDKQIAKQKTAK